MTAPHIDRAEHDRPSPIRLALESLHQADVLRRLVAGAAQGDADAFLGAAAQVTWPGGWVDALRALVALGTIPNAIQGAFLDAWQASASQPFGLRRTMTCDLLGQDALLLDGLSVLLPTTQPIPAHATFYAVAPLDGYKSGHLGLWWTGERSLALPVSVATSAFHEWDGDLVLLATEAPASAIVYNADDLEVLVDPRRLGPVRVLGTLKDDRENALNA
ncbi:hypothetical protein PMNALOAF_3167 [Methylobacterium adhaesivum]|uniref:Uncharacterized protein n=1 Tax=Methylobacterium adhaesivum TaxID=333297 RepID=A0ABT8BLJ8_9HYPH|nr:hypothetical protein [Methylobacterium adhaesivum]MDN3592387.1 hypothetical protein [Methylobacterium adhaesivum]GJD31903.1 hypothetical protein PMNALOAF_3167 [Methylobacterium adhaesivum]